MRINKYLAACNVAGRRKCDEIIKQGRVTLNGRVVDNLATDVKEHKDVVALDGKTLRYTADYKYILLNKPKGYVTTVRDEYDRKTVMWLVEKWSNYRLFPVGRLDYDTEGLLILTNDGDLANRLTHPRNEIPKTYVARLSSGVEEEELQQLRSGIVIDGQKTHRARVKLLPSEGGKARVEVVISEGRNHQVKKMFEAVGKQVEFLKRTKVGELKISGLNRGEARELTPEEVNYLKKL